MLAYIAFGANLGDRLKTWSQVKQKLHATVGDVVATSSLYETEPVGGPEQAYYINAVLVVETKQTPHALMASLLQIEESLGRIRTIPWGPRVVDLDLLLMDDVVLDLPGPPALQLPHPRLVERRFVLVPLTEIAPNLKYPQSQNTMSDLLDACSDTSAVLSLQT